MNKDYTSFSVVMGEADSPAQCSACGKTYTDTLELQEFYEVAFFGGYASIFGDGAHVYGDFCQACIKRLLGEYLEVTQPKELEELEYSGDDDLTVEELANRIDALFAHRSLWQRFRAWLQRLADGFIK